MGKGEQIHCAIGESPRCYAGTSTTVSLTVSLNFLMIRRILYNQGHNFDVAAHASGISEAREIQALYMVLMGKRPLVPKISRTVW